MIRKMFIVLLAEAIKSRYFVANETLMSTYFNSIDCISLRFATILIKRLLVCFATTLRFFFVFKVNTTHKQILFVRTSITFNHFDSIESCKCQRWHNQHHISLIRLKKKEKKISPRVGCADRLACACFARTKEK